MQTMIYPWEQGPIKIEVYILGSPWTPLGLQKCDYNLITSNAQQILPIRENL